MRLTDVSTPARSSCGRVRAALCCSPLFFFMLLLSPPQATALAPGGVIEGSLVNRTDAGRVPAGAEVDVVSLAGGMSVLKSARTDEAGRFTITGLPIDAPLMIRASYESVNYHQTIRFDASGKAQVELEVFETGNSLRDVQLRDVRLAFQLDGDRLRSLESYSFDNRTNPPRAIVIPEGTFRFSKAPGLTEIPRLSILGPGSTLPLSESPLESADGQSYYSLYPLRPGITTFEVEQVLPYENRSYTYRKRFYQDIDSFNIGVIPKDMVVSGPGLERIQVEDQRNFAVYAGSPARAEAELVWTLSGGTPTVASPSPDAGGGSRITQMPTSVGRNAFVLGPLLLMGFIAALWYSFRLSPEQEARVQEQRGKALRERRDQLISYLAVLEKRCENNALGRTEYARLKDQARSQLRRVTVLLGKR